MPGTRRTLTINFAAVADSENQNRNFAILDLADDAIVAHPVAPQTAKTTCQRLAESARIF